jgi:hypothetical protein
MLEPETKPTLNWITQLQSQSFSFATFQFTFQAKEHSFLPEYKGSALRGAFGHSFRKVCCTMQWDQPCSTCMLNQNCPYAYIFETPKVSGMNLEHQADNLPHPFVIEPPLTEQTEFQAGDEFEIGLVLFGKSVDFLPYFVFTFDQMGKMGLGKGKGRFELTKAFGRDDLVSETKTEIYDGHSQMLNSNYKTWNFADLLSQQQEGNVTQMKLHLLTPTRILNQNRIVNEVPFDLLLRNLLRRISLLGRIHCESNWDLPYKEILDHAASQVRLVASQTSWYDWERYSNRQQQRMNMGGIVGELVYEGELAPFLPLLRLGQFTHIGKNTTFGLGKYIIERGDM